jgi:hypothetical protein
VGIRVRDVNLDKTKLWRLWGLAGFLDNFFDPDLWTGHGSFLPAPGRWLGSP